MSSVRVADRGTRRASTRTSPPRGRAFCRQSANLSARPCPRHVSDGYARWGAPCRSQGSRKCHARRKFCVGGPVPGAGPGEALHRAVRSVEIAEEAGLDTAWLAEHHFVPYGTCPSAVTLAALLLGRTRRIRVGTAVSVLPTVHPVALGEQARAAARDERGRFSLGVGRGGPWVDLEVFGAGLAAYEQGFPESLDLLMRWLREPSVAGTGDRFAFREVPVVPRPSEALSDAPGPEVVVACTSPASVRLAAERGLPMLLGMHVGDEEKAEMVALWRQLARAAGRPAEEIRGVAHVSGRRLPDRGPARRRRGGAGEGDAGLAAAGARRPCDRGRPRAPDARPARVHRTALRAAPGGHPAAVRRPARGDLRADRHLPLRPARRGLRGPCGDRGERTAARCRGAPHLG